MQKNTDQIGKISITYREESKIIIKKWLFKNFKSAVFKITFYIKKYLKRFFKNNLLFKINFTSSLSLYI